jgi:hypothetical protein
MKKKKDWLMVAMGAATFIDPLPGDEIIGVALIIKGLGFF